MQRTTSSPSGRGSSGSHAARLSHSMPRDHQQQHFDNNNHNHTPPPLASTLYTPSAVPFHGEFFPVKVLSIRNLRLPKHHLFPDQVGTIGLELSRRADAPAALKIRKGMILGRALSTTAPTPLNPIPLPSFSSPLAACAAFKARFDVDDYHVMEPGALFNVYIASVRAAAKIVTVEIAPPPSGHVKASALFTSQELSERDRTLPLSVLSRTWRRHDNGATAAAAQDIFGLDDVHAASSENTSGGVALHDSAQNNKDEDEDAEEAEEEEEEEEEEEREEMIDVVFQLLNYREWIEVGAQVLVMPGSALEGSVGLDGFVGRVTALL